MEIDNMKPSWSDEYIDDNCSNAGSNFKRSKKSLCLKSIHWRSEHYLLAWDDQAQKISIGRSLSCQSSF